MTNCKRDWEIEERRLDFERVIKPVMEWLSNNYHPHAKIIVDYTSAELVEGTIGMYTTEYVKD